MMGKSHPLPPSRNLSAGAPAAAACINFLPPCLDPYAYRHLLSLTEDAQALKVWHHTSLQHSNLGTSDHYYVVEVIIIMVRVILTMVQVIIMAMVQVIITTVQMIITMIQLVVTMAHMIITIVQVIITMVQVFNTTVQVIITMAQVHDHHHGTSNIYLLFLQDTLDLPFVDISASIDGPEGGLDALAQVAACDDVSTIPQSKTCIQLLTGMLELLQS